MIVAMNCNMRSLPVLPLDLRIEQFHEIESYMKSQLTKAYSVKCAMNWLSRVGYWIFVLYSVSILKPVT